MSNKPLFYGRWGTLRLAFKSSPASINLASIVSVLKLRKKLLLNKVASFNGQYYSTLTIPAFPSPAFDNMVSKGGLNFGSYGTSLKKNIESAFLAITSDCPNNCSHCYEKHNLYNNSEIPVEKWIKITDTLQQRGTNIIILTGGEPLARFDDLLRILKAGDKNLSDFHLHTSGNLLTKEKALLLKEAGLKAAAVGFDDHEPERFEVLRQKGMYTHAINALKIFNEAGIVTYVNLCASKEFINSGSLYEYYEVVKKLNVSFIQLLEPRPCGGFLNADDSVLLNDEEKKTLTDFTKKINYNKKHRNGPIVYYVAHIEGKKQMGCCMGGISHFAIDSAGNVNPCVFLPVTFGNIMEEDFNVIFNRMRDAVPNPVKKDCASLLLADTIRNYADSGIPVSYSKIKKEWKEML